LKKVHLSKSLRHSALVALICILSHVCAHSITNGSVSSSINHPWLVKIDTCAGAILSPRHIITVAHCLSGKTVGLVTLKLNNGERLKRPTKIWLHPLYSSWKESEIKRHDIAIIETSAPIVFGELVKPIRLSDSKPKKNTLINLSGWGRLADNSYPRLPHSIENLSLLPLFDSSYWEDRDNLTQLESDSESQNFKESFFTGDFLAIAVSKNHRRSACRGDSGAPLISSQSSTLIGLVSHGQDDCENQPAFFATDTYQYFPWINQVMKQVSEL
jgi:secreted trypsin-like serine protease